MLLTGTMENYLASRERKQFDDATLWKTQLIVTSEQQSISPNAYLVEQFPNTVLRPHFHRNVQFQVIVAGSGSLGRHKLRPVMIHYAAPQTAYGPLVAGIEGLSYFTLRPFTESGGYFLPESVATMDRTLRRKQVTSEALESFGVDQLKQQAHINVEVMIPLSPTGLAANLVRFPPNATAPAPTWPNNGGRYYLITEGSLVLEHKEYPRWSVVWASGSDENPVLHAGRGGLEIVIAQFPIGSELPVPPLARSALSNPN